MGGRGIQVDNHNSQISLDQYLFSQEINTIRTLKESLRRENQEYNAQGINGRAAHNLKRSMKRCACCRRYSIPAFSQYETCPVCGWIDDPNQNCDPQLEEGANPYSLSEARKRWQEKQKDQNTRSTVSLMVKS